MELRTAAVQPMQSPSLQQMLATISPLMLDQTVGDAHLAVIATALVNWRSVCTNLGISAAEEAAIEEENQTADTRRRAVLRRWRSKYGPNATYKSLANCFYNAGQLDMVEAVCRALRTPSSPVTQQQEGSSVRVSVINSSQAVLTHGFSSTNAEVTRFNVLSSRPSFQQLSSSEQEELKETLDEDVRRMRRLFGSLVTQTRDSVEERIPVRNFAGSILALGAYEPAPEVRDRSLLDEHREDINRATTISEIFNILCAYWNYLSYEVLEYIIEHYGTRDDTERLRRYNEELHRFCERRIFELPLSESGSGTGNASSPRQERFVVKLKVREDTTCEEARRIKGIIARILNVRLATLIIHTLDLGCVQLTFLIPKFVAQEIFPLSKEQTSALSRDASVIRLTCQDYVFESCIEGQSTASLELEGNGQGTKRSQLQGDGANEPKRPKIQRRPNCGKCIGCQEKEDCGSCLNCLDRQGPNRRHARCIKRKCLKLKYGPKEKDGQQQLGELTVQPNEHLGDGSFGTVYKASYQGTPAAAKYLYCKVQDQGSFKHELENLQSFIHPNLVAYRAAPLGPGPILVMELMEKTLSQFLGEAKNDISIHLQVNLCLDITFALAYLHSQQIVHGHLTSNNVLLVGTTAKVADFGISKLLNSQTSVTHTATYHQR